MLLGHHISVNLFLSAGDSYIDCSISLNLHSLNIYNKYDNTVCVAALTSFLP